MRQKKNLEIAGKEKEEGVQIGLDWPLAMFSNQELNKKLRRKLKTTKSR